MEGLIRLASTVALIASAACGNEGTANGVRAESPVDSVSDPAKDIVLRARAFDRADNLDSARVLYEEAAKKSPLVRDWLLLRAAGVTRDKAARDYYLGDVKLAVAETRRRPTEAIALERSGDVEGAIAAYTEVGDRLAAVRLRMLVPSDTVKMLAARRSLVAILAGPGNGQNARDAIVLFDKVYKTPTSQEQLVIARAAFVGGLASRVAAHARDFMSM